MGRYRLGIDLGGTKIEGAAMAADGRMVLRERVATPQGDYKGTLQAVVDLVRRLESDIGDHTSVGIGIPGALSPATGLVKNANSVWLIGHALKDDLERRLERPLRLANDANCFVLSEARDGAAVGAHVVFGVIIGTGTGGGLAVDGQVWTGPNAIGGEWGHNPLPWPRDDERPGPPCYCGKTGCLETFLSGPGFARDYREQTGPARAPAAIAAEAIAGDAKAGAALTRYEDRLARGLASVIVIDPDMIVLGGGMSNIERLYATVPRQWEAYVFSDHVTTPLVRAAHGDSSGVRGAAWLW